MDEVSASSEAQRQWLVMIAGRHLFLMRLTVRRKFSRSFDSFDAHFRYHRELEHAPFPASTCS